MATRQGHEKRLAAAVSGRRQAQSAIRRFESEIISELVDNSRLEFISIRWDKLEKYLSCYEPRHYDKDNKQKTISV
jgi:hypothetical protein